MKIPTICRYCGGVIRLEKAKKIYGASTERLGLAGQMELPEEDAHIGGFEMDQCQQVIDLCEKEWNKGAVA